MRLLSKVFSCLILMTVWVQAQLAHEVVLLVNETSPASVKVANYYAAARGIPLNNMVFLQIPESVYGGDATMTPKEFTKLIWEPATAAIKKQGIEDQTLAWVYSVDFPIRVKTDSSDRKQLSVGGLTFLRNELIDLESVEKGTYLSKLFAGPSSQLKLNLPSISLGLYKNGLGIKSAIPPEVAYLTYGLGARMPIPSMMLGYIGENGNEVETVLNTIKLGVQSGYRGSKRGIYFVKSDDVRSTCRDWQFDPVAQELKGVGVAASVVTNFPAGASNVMGIIMGAEKLDASSIKSFMPGAMAEHLTSWGAEFQRPQTKVTDWIKAGVTASAGSVVEPYANPNKFTSARFFVHYTAGSTMLESFYQSIACPLQILLLGDPLAKPYGYPYSVRILGLDRLNNDFTYYAQVQSNAGEGVNYQYTFLLDGKVVQKWSDNPAYFVSLDKVSDGYHTLRVVSRIQHKVDLPATKDHAFTVDRLGRSIELCAPSTSEGSKHGLGVKMGGEELPVRLKLISGARLLDEQDFAPDALLTLDEKLIGEGPNKIQAIAVYKDGMEVASAPFVIEIKFAATK